MAHQLVRPIRERMNASGRDVRKEVSEIIFLMRRDAHLNDCGTVLHIQVFRAGRYDSDCFAHVKTSLPKSMILI
jgi:hypothetical protein